MALKDIDGQQNGTQYCWYYESWRNAAFEVENDQLTSDKFGEGKNNTEVMINKWNNKAYGEQDKEPYYNYKDVWGVIIMLDLVKHSSL